MERPQRKAREALYGSALGLSLSSGIKLHGSSLSLQPPRLDITSAQWEIDGFNLEGWFLSWNTVHHGAALPYYQVVWQREISYLK